MTRPLNSIETTYKNSILFFYFYQILNAFTNLKILSEVVHDYWKSFKLFTGLRAGQYKLKPGMDIQNVDIWNFDIFLGQPKETDIRWGSFWKQNKHIHLCYHWLVFQEWIFIAKSHQGWSLVCEMWWVWYFEQNISTHDI